MRHRRIASKRLSDRAVALVIKRAAEAAGLDPKRVAGHLLRRGHATQRAKNGDAEREIMRTTRHRSERMLRRYISEGHPVRAQRLGKPRGL